MNKVERLEKMLNSERYFRPEFGDLNNLANLRSIVLSDPKTGSTSFAHSLESALSGQHKLSKVIHMHTDRSCIHTLFPTLEEYDLGIRELVRLHKKVSQHKLIFVNTYREPFSRSISHFFHNIVVRTGLSKEEILELSSEELVSLYSEKYAHSHINPHIHWQYSKFFNFDMRVAGNQIDRGLVSYDTPNHDLVLVRIDKMQEGLNYVLNMMGVPDAPIVKDNESKDHWYGKIYSDFLANYCPRQNLLNCMIKVELPLLLEFYTMEEVEDLYSKLYARYGYEFDMSIVENTRLNVRRENLQTTNQLVFGNV